MTNQNKRITTEGRTFLPNVIPLSTPYLVFVDPANVCSFSCKFCPTGKDRGAHKYRLPTTMSMTLFDKTLNELCLMPERIKVLRLYMMGEPLMNKNFPLMVSKAKYKNRFDQIDTTTNASLLNKDLSRKIIDAGLDKLFVSVSAINNKKLRSFVDMVSVDIDKIRQNVEDFYVMSRGKCEVYVKCIEENLEEGEKELFF